MTLNDNHIHIWLRTSLIVLVLMVLIGGITRLTQSGLSITTWKPIMGVVPPLNDSDWNIHFNEYKKVYADTLMGGFLVTSLSLLISLSKSQLHTINISSISILIASVFLICAASLTKQGAMLWSIMFYPLLAYIIIYKKLYDIIY